MSPSLLGELEGVRGEGEVGGAQHAAGHAQRPLPHVVGGVLEHQIPFHDAQAPAEKGLAIM